MIHSVEKDAIREVRRAMRALYTSVPADVARDVAERVESALAQAWWEGHLTYRRLGPDACTCSAWNESECGCGEYGTNVVTPNPYRPTRAGGGDA